MLIASWYCNYHVTRRRNLVQTAGLAHLNHHGERPRTLPTNQGELVDLFVPRKCAATGRLIEAKDHASVQIAIAEVDDNGKIIPGQVNNVPICGAVRHQAESDDSLNRILQEQGCTYRGHTALFAPDSLRLVRASPHLHRGQDSIGATVMRRIKSLLAQCGPVECQTAATVLCGYMDNTNNRHPQRVVGPAQVGISQKCYTSVTRRVVDSSCTGECSVTAGLGYWE